MNKIGITQWMQPLPLAQLAATITKYGYTGIGLQFNQDYKENSVFVPSIRAEALELKKIYNLDYPSMGVNIFCQVSLCAPEQFDLACNILADAVYAAKETGVPLLQVPAFYASRIHTEEELQNTAKVFRTACQAAQNYDVMISSENALTTEQNRTLVKLVNCENFALYFDTDNPFRFAGYNGTEQVAPLLPCITQVHLKDADNLGATLLGQGNSGFLDTVAEFKRGGFDGWYLSETNYNQIMQRTGMQLDLLLAEDAKTITSLGLA